MFLVEFYKTFEKKFTFSLPTIEVKKIMTPRPKEITQWANLMTSNHKRDEFPIKKKDGRPKSFEAQKPMEKKL